MAKYFEGKRGREHTRATREFDSPIPVAARPPEGVTHDPRPHRAFIMSRAMIFEACLAAFVHGVACTGENFNGETIRDGSGAQRMLRTEFERWWTRREAGDV